MSENSYTMVMVTTDDEDKAVELAKKLIAEKLAACVQITNIRSVFFWDGKTDDAQEYLLLAKTREAIYDELEDFIKENHDYEVPEILKVPILGGFGPYLQWMDENTTK